MKKTVSDFFNRLLGYLSDLRSDGQNRRARPLSTLGGSLCELCAETPAHVHMATIMDDNRAAKAALTWKNLGPAIPRFVDQGRFLTHLLPLLWKRGLGTPCGLMQGRPDMLEDIVRFLNTEGRAKQFFPAYTVAWLQSLPDFSPENFGSSTLTVEFASTNVTPQHAESSAFFLPIWVCDF